MRDYDAAEAEQIGREVDDLLESVLDFGAEISQACRDRPCRAPGPIRSDGVRARHHELRHRAADLAAACDDWLARASQTIDEVDPLDFERIGIAQFRLMTVHDRLRTYP